MKHGLALKLAVMTQSTPVQLDFSAQIILNAIGECVIGDEWGPTSAGASSPSRLRPPTSSRAATHRSLHRKYSAAVKAGPHESQRYSNHQATPLENVFQQLGLREDSCLANGPSRRPYDVARANERRDLHELGAARHEQAHGPPQSAR